MADSSAVDPLLTKIGASVVGAAVSLKFMQGTRVERGLMFVGAAGSSYFATDWVAAHLHMQDAEGLVGLLLGLYSMPLVAKVYESISLLDTQAISKAIGDRLTNIFGR